MKPAAKLKTVIEQFGRPKIMKTTRLGVGSGLTLRELVQSRLEGAGTIAVHMCNSKVTIVPSLILD